MKPQVKQGVAILTSSVQLLRNLDVSLALGGASASGGKDGNQAFEFSPRFKHEKLFLDLHFRDPESVATQRNN